MIENISKEISKILKFIFAAYTAVNEKIAEWINPVQKEVKTPIGEILYNSFIFIGVIFLNCGALRLISKIGTSAIDNKRDININGSKFFGVLIFNNNEPKAIEKKVINI